MSVWTNNLFLCGYLVVHGRGDGVVEVPDPTPGQTQQSNPASRVGATMGEVVGVSVVGDDGERQEYYQELFRLLQELEVLLEVFESKYLNT